MNRDEEKRVEAMRVKMEGILQAFQRDLIQWQAKVNVMWNTMNVFIRVLTKKGIVTQEEFVEAGKELMAEAHANLAKAKSSAETGIPLKGDAFTRVPMEEAVHWMDRIRAEKKAESGGGEGGGQPS